MKRLIVNLSDEELSKLENFLEKKTYSSRSEAFRYAIELLIESEKLPKLKNVIEKLRERSVVDFGPTEREIKHRIIEYLRKHPRATINEISGGTKLHRHTVRKYLVELTKLKIVHQKKVGTCKVSFISAKGRRKWDG